MWGEGGGGGAPEGGEGVPRINVAVDKEDPGCRDGKASEFEVGLVHLGLRGEETHGGVRGKVAGM